MTSKIPGCLDDLNDALWIQEFDLSIQDALQSAEVRLIVRMWLVISGILVAFLFFPPGGSFCVPDLKAIGFMFGAGVSGGALHCLFAALAAAGPRTEFMTDNLIGALHNGKFQWVHIADIVKLNRGRQTLGVWYQTKSDKQFRLMSFYKLDLQILKTNKGAEAALPLLLSKSN